MESAFRVIANRVDIIAGQIEPASIEVVHGRIAKIEPVSSATGFALPGFVDSHIHIESSMVLPCEFARVAVLHGTVATVSDPHEIANVCGADGVELMLGNAEKSPLKFYFGAPSCVPATSFETAGAELDSGAVARLLDDPRINHLSEMMNFPGVLSGDLEVMSKIIAAKARGLPVDGHAPGLHGKEAKRYIDAGIATDHECVELAEALGKIDHGAKIAIREGSAARNFDALWSLIDLHPTRCMFCSDDKHPDDLIDSHINQLVIRAIRNGCDLMNTLRVACQNPVSHYSLDVGQLQVGDPADFIVVDDLEDFRVQTTYIDGVAVAKDGVSLIESPPAQQLNRFGANRIELGALAVPAEAKRIRVIDVDDGQLVTRSSVAQAPIENGFVVSRPEDDLAKLVVVNRYQNAPPAVAFVRGFGLQRGAIASSVAHDSHNIVAVGVTDAELLDVINVIVDARGGLAATHGEAVELMSLQIAGLMSRGSVEFAAEEYAKLSASAKLLGCGLAAPFMTLSFLALPVIPSLKLSDRGLFDVDAFCFTSLFVS